MIRCTTALSNGGKKCETTNQSGGIEQAFKGSIELRRLIQLRRLFMGQLVSAGQIFPRAPKPRERFQTELRATIHAESHSEWDERSIPSRLAKDRDSGTALGPSLADLRLESEV